MFPRRLGRRGGVSVGIRDWVIWYDWGIRVRDDAKSKEQLIAELRAVRARLRALRTAGREQQAACDHCRARFEDYRRAEALREEVFHITRHDMKTPLAGIVGLCECLKNEDNLRPDQRHTLGVLQKAGHRMLNMIEVALAVQKMEKGGYSPERRLVDLAATLRQVLTESHLLIARRKLRVDMMVEAENATRAFYGEENLLATMLSNLVRNALEASSSGDTVTLRVRFRDMAEVEIANRLEVPEAIRSVFFQKYVTHGKRGGTGLGTYTAKLIAESHGGDIALRVTPGVGTSVLTRLPFVSPDADAALGGEAL